MGSTRHPFCSLQLLFIRHSPPPRLLKCLKCFCCPRRVPSPESFFLLLVLWRLTNLGFSLPLCTDLFCRFEDWKPQHIVLGVNKNANMRGWASIDAAVTASHYWFFIWSALRCEVNCGQSFLWHWGTKRALPHEKCKVEIKACVLYIGVRLC